MHDVEIRHFHLFAGLGGGARGFNRGEARIGTQRARFRCLGGIDSDAASIADFGRIAGVPGTVMDLFDRDQYRAWHGHEPPTDWHEVSPADIRRAAGNERPHIVFTSAPCKGFSGLLSEKRSTSEKYQAFNRLTLRGIWLTLEAWADDPPEFILFENVPRIANRGRPLLDQIEALLQQYGYATAETTHDCGELGGLAQSRRRFLLVARHQEKVPPFLYEPQTHPLRGVGEVLENLPLPGDVRAGPMHRLPSLQWRTWVRLALVEAGSDWRSLQRLRVEDGVLADYGIAPDTAWQSGVLGVNGWDDTCGTVTGRGRPTNGGFAVADPRRAEGRGEYGQYGVKAWADVGQAVTGKAAVGAGRFAVADPRGPAFGGKYRVTHWDGQAGTVISGSTTGQGAFSVADPRIGKNGPRFNNVYRVVRWDQHRPAVTGGGGPTAGGVSIADPRLGWGAKRPAFHGGGHYGVVTWGETARAVTGKAKHDTGLWSVADPRAANDAADYSSDYALPAATDRGVYVIRSLDDTWHRPFTTLELAALQGLVNPEEHLELYGRSDSAWRERIGNAVPSPAAQAIAGVMGRTLLLAWSGETFALDAMPIWVRPMAVALSVQPGGEA